MDYIRTEADGQLTLTQSTEYLILPSCTKLFFLTSRREGVRESPYSFVKSDLCCSIMTIRIASTATLSQIMRSIYDLSILSVRDAGGSHLLL